MTFERIALKIMLTTRTGYKPALGSILAVMLALGAPATARAQEKPPAPPPTEKAAQGAAQTDHSKAGRQRRNSRNRSTQPAQQGATLHVIPVSQAPGSLAVPSGQAVKLGPDGKPLPAGPDGKPLVVGPDGKSAFPGPGGPPPGGTGSSIFNSLGGGRRSFDGSPSGGGGLVSMDFRGSDINNVLEFFSMAAGWQIIPDPTLSGPVTIISPKQLTIDQAFQVLQSVLQIRGFSGQLETHGSTQILKIVGLDRAVAGGAKDLFAQKLDENGKPLPPDQQPKPNPDTLRNQVITQVFPIENVDAGTLSRELTPLINKGASIIGSAGTNALIVTDTAMNVQRVGELIQVLDKAASNNEIKRFALTHADATEVANAINTLFRQLYSRGRGGNPNQQGQPNQGGGAVQFQPGGGQPGQPGQPGGVGDPQRAAIVAVADTRSNSVLVVASKDNLVRVEALIKDLDDPEATALSTYIRKMQYADALDVADTINSMLSGTVPGRSNNQGASFQQRVFGGGGFGGFGGGGGQSTAGSVQSTDPFAKVVGNARTNSLLITATKEKMDRIDELIKDLDVPVTVETTTFVVPLKNVQAQDLAYTLGQAFGTSQNSNNPFGGGGFGNIFGFGGNNRNSNGLNQRQPIQRRQGQSSRSVPIGSQSRAIAPQNGAAMDQNGYHGTMTPGGFVPDAQTASQDSDITRGQFFFGGRGGFGGGGQMNTPQFGRGAGGSYVNLLQLRQNVGVVPDINSNALVITTTPDNMRAIQQIIDSLDIIPRQVMIEVIIAEASLDATQKLGFQFDVKGVGKLLGTAITHGGASNFALGAGATVAQNIAGPLNPGGQYGVQALNGNFNGLLQALATDNRVHILSTPKIFTSNNQQAEIDVTQNIPIVAQNAGFGFGTSNSVTFLPVGITVNVTPRITKDGLVTMDIVASDTELLGFDTLQTGTDANGRPIFSTAPRTSDRTTDTSVSAKDGEIIALGGLMRDNKTVDTNKVPLLGDIPILGALFRSRTITKSKTELMIFLVPHVVDSEAQNRKLVQEQAKKIMKDVPELTKEFPNLKPKNGEGAGEPGKPDAGAKPNEGENKSAKPADASKPKQIEPDRSKAPDPDNPKPSKS